MILSVGAWLAGTTTALRAQAVVTGQVTDSLTGRPFAGATVQIVPANAPWSAGQTTLSDSLGRFRIDAVDAGIYTFGFTHPRLDSLGMDAVTRRIAVNAGASTLVADLALPSAVTAMTAPCEHCRVTGHGGQSDSVTDSLTMSADSSTEPTTPGAPSDIAAERVHTDAAAWLARQ